MMMNGWFLAAGALLAAAFFVHVFSGNRFYSARALIRQRPLPELTRRG